MDECERPYKELRDSLNRHVDWPTSQSAAGVIDAARRLVRAVESQAEMIALMREQVSPSQEALASLLAVDEKP